MLFQLFLWDIIDFLMIKHTKGNVGVVVSSCWDWNLIDIFILTVLIYAEKNLPVSK